jgi:DNA modification methylase
VDLVVTSPPYFGLRSYQDAGEHYDGQIGAEATPAEFVDALIQATREMVRCLKPSGSIWVNLGDKYAGSRMDGSSGNDTLANSASYIAGRAIGQGKKFSSGGIPTKSLMGIPWRYALRCIDDLGLILRAEVIWAKPNGLPESVTDRVRRSHETWFHFTKEPRYFSAVDEIREEHLEPHRSSRTDGTGKRQDAGAGTFKVGNKLVGLYNSLGKLPGSVWSVPTQPLQVPPELGIDHFAAFPMEWPRRIIQGWSPVGVCTLCGEGRRPVSASERVASRPSGVARIGTRMDAVSGVARVRSDVGNVRTAHSITGYACACPEPSAPTVPAVVLDPFGGTGTTALVAKALGRHGVSVDMSADYCRLAEWRTTDRGQLAAAMQVEKPAAVHPDQLDLFSA